jgi:stage IV sporulation protein FB
MHLSLMIDFHIFGIPVRIQPMFWLSMGLFGISYLGAGSDGLLLMAIFILAAFVSILVHELGHALVGMKLGGGSASIELVAFGGFAYSYGARLTRWGKFWQIAAGPGAGFLLFGIIALSMVFILGAPGGILYVLSSIFGTGVTSPVRAFIEQNMMRHELISKFLWMNFWWSLFNLLPIYPLDGGKILEVFAKNPRTVFLTGTITAVVIGLFALKIGLLLAAIILFFYAWQNYQAMR